MCGTGAVDITSGALRRRSAVGSGGAKSIIRLAFGNNLPLPTIAHELELKERRDQLMVFLLVGEIFTDDEERDRLIQRLTTLLLPKSHSAGHPSWHGPPDTGIQAPLVSSCLGTVGVAAADVVEGPSRKPVRTRTRAEAMFIMIAERISNGKNAVKNW